MYTCVACSLSYLISHTVEQTRHILTMQEVETKLSQFSALSQKDKGPAYQALLSDILARPHPTSIPSDLHIFVNAVVNQDNAGLVVGRQVLSELVRMLGEGIIKDHELRKRVVEDTLAIVQPRIVSYEEQVRHFIGNRLQVWSEPLM